MVKDLYHEVKEHVKRQSKKTKGDARWSALVALGQNVVLMYLQKVPARTNLERGQEG
jgi:hypothetical protein